MQAAITMPEETNSEGEYFLTERCFRRSDFLAISQGVASSQRPFRAKSRRDQR
jgi:hypothetical protein